MEEGGAMTSSRSKVYHILTQRRVLCDTDTSLYALLPHLEYGTNSAPFRQLYQETPDGVKVLES